jgi:hypothetical protein
MSCEPSIPLKMAVFLRIAKHQTGTVQPCFIRLEIWTWNDLKQHKKSVLLPFGPQPIEQNPKGTLWDPHAFS